MSADDIQFGEVRFREPIKACRPDRDPKLACLAYGLPGAMDLPIFLDKKAADKVERHALSDTSVELGGILLGKECVDEKNGAPFVWITEGIEAKHYESSEARFKYTHESWQEITRERDRLHPDLDIVGWYHTHPDFGIFLSGLDLFIHENYFNQPLQVAYVVDPIRQTRGFFQWRNGRMESEPISGFFLVADRGDRIALSRFVNDLEGIPNSDGGGGGLSPRLEAQLIAMLSRPQYAYAPSGHDQARLSAFQTMFGVVLGMVALGAVLWINSLSAQIREQAATIKDLSATIKESRDYQRITFDTLLAREERKGEGTPSATFFEGYKKALADRDRLKAEADNRNALIDQAAEKMKTALSESSKLRTELTEARLKREEAEVALRTANEKLKDFAELRDKFDTQTGSLDASKELLKELTKDGGKGLISRYNTAWYSAVLGWLVAAGAGLGLVWLWTKQNPVDDHLLTSAPGRPIVVPIPNNPGSTIPSQPQHASDDPPHIIS